MRSQPAKHQPLTKSLLAALFANVANGVNTIHPVQESGINVTVLGKDRPSKTRVAQLSDVLTVLWERPVCLTLVHVDSTRLNSAAQFHHTLMSIIDVLDWRTTVLMLNAALQDNTTLIKGGTNPNAELIRLYIKVSGVTETDLLMPNRVFRFTVLTPPRSTLRVTEAFQAYTVNYRGVISVQVVMEYAITPLVQIDG